MLTKKPDKPVINPSWSAALRDFDEGMRRQQLAEKTRRAYGVDLGQLAEWAGANALAPEQLDFRALRRFAGVLSERGMSRSTVARKLASTRSFYAQHGARRDGWRPAPRTWCPRPSATSTCRPCSSPPS